MFLHQKNQECELVTMTPIRINIVNLCHFFHCKLICFCKARPLIWTKSASTSRLCERTLMNLFSKICHEKFPLKDAGSTYHSVTLGLCNCLPFKDLPIQNGCLHFLFTCFCYLLKSLTIMNKEATLNGCLLYFLTLNCPFSGNCELILQL